MPSQFADKSNKELWVGLLMHSATSALLNVRCAILTCSILCSLAVFPYQAALSSNLTTIPNHLQIGKDWNDQQHIQQSPES
eukprot:15367179-Ditylum_brightwellii.AAC.3